MMNYRLCLCAPHKFQFTSECVQTYVIHVMPYRELDHMVQQYHLKLDINKIKRACGGL